MHRDGSNSAVGCEAERSPAASGTPPLRGRRGWRGAGLLLLLPLLLLPASRGVRPCDADSSPPNVLLITVDDMNYDTPGCFGGRLGDVTPHIDALAASGRRFTRVHVAVAVCQPSRECLMSGRFPQTNGATGFRPLDAGIPTLPQLLKGRGYRVGILGKTTDLKPEEAFPWDDLHGQHELGAGRDAGRYHACATQFFAAAKASGQPFFLMANSHDPHRPFSGAADEREALAAQVRRAMDDRRPGGVAAGKSGDGEGDGEETRSPETPLPPGSLDFPAPSRSYGAADVVVPGFLPDLPQVREEVAQYCSSCRRADDMVGKVLEALDESGLADRTIVVFLSDNGLSMPFAKSNCYLASTHTPCIIRWPGRTPPGTADDEHFISAVDFLPTLLEAVGAPPTDGLDGRSFLPLLAGEVQTGRDHLFTCYNDTAGNRRYPMRCVQDARFGYIFNAWSDGRTTYRAEPMTGLAFDAMQRAARTDPVIAERVELLLHRVPEEFYDLQRDPDALHNLVGDSKYAEEVARMRDLLAGWMERTKDPVLPAFKTRMR